MKLAVVGSRKFVNYSLVEGFLDMFLDLHPDDLTIISGGALGADSCAERWAKAHNIPIIVHLPKWTLFGRAAGPMRNQLIVDDCDALIAFKVGHFSIGTDDSIRKAKKADKVVMQVITAKGSIP